MGVDPQQAIEWTEALDQVIESTGLERAVRLLAGLSERARTRIYARAFLEGRLSEEHLRNFRHELRDHPGLPSYSHPCLMPDFWTASQTLHVSRIAHLEIRQHFE